MHSFTGSKSRLSGIVVICGLVGLVTFPLKAIAGSAQISQAEKQRLIDQTPATVIFRIKAYQINDEKAITVCTNFASIVRKPEVPIVVNKAQFDSSIQDSAKQRNLKLYSSPNIRSMVGIPAFTSQGNGKNQFSVRGQADMVDGKIVYRFMASTIVFNANDKANPFWSDSQDGPFALKTGQMLAIYNKGGNGKVGILTTFEPVFDSSLTINP